MWIILIDYMPQGKMEVSGFFSPSDQEKKTCCCRKGERDRCELGNNLSDLSVTCPTTKKRDGTDLCCVVLPIYCPQGGDELGIYLVAVMQSVGVAFEEKSGWVWGRGIRV